MQGIHRDARQNKQVGAHQILPAFQRQKILVSHNRSYFFSPVQSRQAPQGWDSLNKVLFSFSAILLLHGVLKNAVAIVLCLLKYNFCYLFIINAKEKA